MLAKLLKVLHELGSIGALGAVAACLTLLQLNRGDPIAAAFTSANIAAIVSFLLLPSFVVVILSGLLALVGTPAYMNAGWAWIKALLGLTLFEALVVVSATSQEAAGLATQLSAGHAGETVVVQFRQALRSEAGVLWVLFGVSLISVIVGVWRPRFARTRTPKP